MHCPHAEGSKKSIEIRNLSAPTWLFGGPEVDLVKKDEAMALSDRIWTREREMERNKECDDLPKRHRKSRVGRKVERARCKPQAHRNSSIH